MIGVKKLVFAEKLPLNVFAFRLLDKLFSTNFLSSLDGEEFAVELIEAFVKISLEDIEDAESRQSSNSGINKFMFVFFFVFHLDLVRDHLIEKTNAIERQN